MEKTLRLVIGNLGEVLYRCVDTSAPRAFDGFGTIEVADCTYKKEILRTVLIRDEHYTWQTQRYASGMYSFEITGHDVAHIEAELWQRVLTSRKD